MTAVYRNYSQHELDAQYEQRTLVPDVAPYFEHWRVRSEQARRTLPCELDVAYGEGDDERLDVFPAADGAPVHVHFHGGAWRLLGKEDASFPALVLVPAGATFITVNFSLAPDASLDEMAGQVRRSVSWVYSHAREYGADPQRLFLSGHSSGAHLCALLCTRGWQEQSGIPVNAIKGATVVSGAYDLEPVRLSARNEYLQLDEAGARRLSPLHHVPARGPPLAVMWGEGELEEFRRQGRTFADAWAAAGNAVIATGVPGRNHFDMSNAFGEPDSPVTRAILAQMGLGRAMRERATPSPRG